MMSMMKVGSLFFLMTVVMTTPMPTTQGSHQIENYGWRFLQNIGGKQASVTVGPAYFNGTGMVQMCAKKIADTQSFNAYSVLVRVCQPGCQGPCINRGSSFGPGVNIGCEKPSEAGVYFTAEADVATGSVAARRNSGLGWICDGGSMLKNLGEGVRFDGQGNYFKLDEAGKQVPVNLTF